MSTSIKEEHSIEFERNDSIYKDGTNTIYRIADANHAMYVAQLFETEEAARQYIKEEYQERDKKDSYDEYWRNRKQVVLKITTIQEVLG